ncbi:MAG: methyl-accepting chemotaxis protein [Candidatus Omnitrophica bacterium]|nr:methyl-accepting chemotaxis protein [Candidatus Omnitrophota bacterium]
MGKRRIVTMRQAAIYRRTQYFIAKKFQLKYVGMILMLVSLTAVTCSYVIYYTMMLTMGDKLANVYPQGRLISIVNMVNFRILLSMLLVAPLAVVIGIYASHKIAGPIYRIEKFLGSMAGGDLSMSLTLRRNDELISLAGGINRVIDSVKATVNKEKAAIGSISISMESLRRLATSEPVNRAALDQALDKLNEEVSVLRSEVEKYKI